MSLNIVFEMIQFTIIISDMESKSVIEVESEFRLKRKKGVRNLATYKVNRIKKARIQGGEYVSYKGKVVEARATELPCS